MNSTISGNSATSSTAAGGGIENYGTLTIGNSTIAGNSTPRANNNHGGGGIANVCGTLTIHNSSIAGNSSTGQGGGVFNYAAGIINARNVIMAGNTAAGANDLFGILGSVGHNLIGNTDGGSGFDPTDLLNVDPLLGPLQDNGGPTFTMALQCGSPAIDSGDNTDAPEWDQRGEGFPRIVNKIIDIGAYEVQKGECGGLAPHGSSDSLNPFIAIGLALDSHLVPISRVANLSAALEVKPIPPVSQSVVATPTPPETITRLPARLGMAKDSLFLDLNLDCSFEKSLICS